MEYHFTKDDTIVFEVRAALKKLGWHQFEDLKSHIYVKDSVPDKRLLVIGFNVYFQENDGKQWQNEGRVPYCIEKGVVKRTANEVIEELKKLLCLE
jgi:hypothetical protein